MAPQSMAVPFNGNAVNGTVAVNGNAANGSTLVNGITPALWDRSKLDDGEVGYADATASGRPARAWVVAAR